MTCKEINPYCATSLFKIGFDLLDCRTYYVPNEISEVKDQNLQIKNHFEL